MTGKPSAIHGFIPKRVCRCMETWLSCPNRHTPVRDTDYLAKKGVSRHKRQPNDRKTVRDTRFHTEKGVSLHGNMAQLSKPSHPCSRYRLLSGERCIAARKAALCTEISPRHRVSPGVSQDYKRERVRRNPPPKRGEARSHTGMATGDSGMSSCYFIRRRPMRARSRSMETTVTLTC